MRNKLTALSLLLVASSAIGQHGYSAKSLFFGEDDSVVVASTAAKSAPGAPEPEMLAVETKKATKQVAYKKPARPSKIGASYFIRLKNDDGSTRDVLASRTFKSGERFQLGVKVNHPTYVYILNEAPDGVVTQIYPQPGHDNFINAMGTVFLPGRGSFEFDGVPGIEQLLVYLSPAPLQEAATERVRAVRPDMVTASAVRVSTAAQVGCPEELTASESPSRDSHYRIQVADLGPGYAAKSISYKDDPTPACGNTPVGAQSAGYASKGIAFSDDPEPAAGGQVASYVVKTSAASTPSDKNLYLKIRLVHE
ncbi:MAG TPA: DUF4384 domain-containing protein [Candidatus Accumulibacter phosphatis]|nr:DUF4384 domain-containing protein [Candidatus Accumulibacter phosphatis]